MKFHVEATSRNGITILRLEHGRDVLFWSVDSYANAAVPSPTTMFNEINEYLSKWPREKQDQLWELYQQMKAVLSDSLNRQTMDNRLNELIIQVYELVDDDSLRDYVYMSKTLNFPSDLKAEYEAVTPRGRNYRERTYLKSEYKDLVALSMGFRFMVPVWGNYIEQISKQSGNDYKETTAMRLLRKSAINRWPAMTRLREYVFSCIDSKASMSSLIGCLSTEEIPEHLLSLAVIRKLALVPLNARTDDDSLARVLHNFITGNYGRLDNRFGGNVGKKQLPTNSNEEDNSSIWDVYKVTQDIPDGDKMLIEVYTENVSVMIDHLDPDLEPSLIQSCLQMTAQRRSQPLERHQKVLIQWIMGDQIPPQAVDMLSKNALLRCLGLIQAALWKWGYPELALLATARRYVPPEDVFIPAEPQAKPTKAQVEQLNVIYPYYRRETRKADPTKRSNIAIKAIDAVTDLLTACQWIPVAPLELVRELPHLEIAGQWSVSPTIKVQLADLIIRLKTTTE